MKKQVKVTVLASALPLALITPAWADSLDPSFEHDMRMAFEIDGQPMELALLSEQECETRRELLCPPLPFLLTGLHG